MTKSPDDCKKPLNNGLKPCRHCGRKAIIEHWSSGGAMYMVKCNNPDCWYPESYPRGNSLPKIIAEWNRRMEDPPHASITANTAPAS